MSQNEEDDALKLRKQGTLGCVFIIVGIIMFILIDGGYL